jgi:hypothetical protein
MKFRFIIVLTVVGLLGTRQIHAQQTEEKAVLTVVNNFFDALEKQDTATLRKVSLQESVYYSIREVENSIRIATQTPAKFAFKPDRIITERMKDTGVVVHIDQRIASVWAPYDLWINNVFSHCGVDVFTLIKNKDGWKISSLSYSVVKEGCNPKK